MTQQSTLPPALLERAESFFAAPLADVEVAVDPEIAGLGASALACGRRIRLAPRVADPALPRNLAVLAHELAHVVQQAEGRTPATGRLNGLPSNDDPALEAEADELARRFVTGGERRSPVLPRAQPAAVVQRLVTVDGIYLPAVGALGERERQVLGLIDQGDAWLEWAIGAPGQLYEFATPGALVDGVQTGLHSSPWTLLPRLALLVSPAKLLTLEEADLGKIVSWEGGETLPSLETPVRAILHRNALWTQADLAAGVGFLDDAGVATRPVFQVLGLRDQLDLLDLLSDPDRPFARQSALATEAAEFAVTVAQTPREFVDYVDFYLATIEKLGTQGLGPDRRTGRARSILEELRPYLSGLLRCPRLDGPLPSPDLAVVLRSWLAGGQAVGFDRLSAALDQVYQHSDLRQQSGEEAERIVTRYMAATQKFLAEAVPVSTVLLQDGATWLYRWENRGGSAELVLQPSRDLTLHSCRLPGSIPAGEGAS